MADKRRVCRVNAVCGEPRGEARWWFKMTESPVDHDYYAQFAKIDGPVAFGVTAVICARRKSSAGRQR